MTSADLAASQRYLRPSITFFCVFVLWRGRNLESQHPSGSGPRRQFSGIVRWTAEVMSAEVQTCPWPPLLAISCNPLVQRQVSDKVLPFCREDLGLEVPPPKVITKERSASWYSTRRCLRCARSAIAGGLSIAGEYRRRLGRTLGQLAGLMRCKCGHNGARLIVRH